MKWNFESTSRYLKEDIRNSLIFWEIWMRFQKEGKNCRHIKGLNDIVRVCVGVVSLPEGSNDIRVLRFC